MAAAAASSGVTPKKRKTENPLATHDQPDTKSSLVVPVRLADGDTISIKPPVNYTPHPLRFFAADGKTLLGTIAPLNSTGIRAQSQPATVLGDLQLVPSKEISVPLKTAQVVSGLAELPKGYDPTQTAVVSALAAQELAKSGHTGLILCVGSSPQDAVRDEKGQIQGTRCLEVYQVTAPSDKCITARTQWDRVRVRVRDRKRATV